MVGETGRRINKFIGRFRETFEKISETVASPESQEEDLIQTVIHRIDIPDEATPPASPATASQEEDKEKAYEKLIRRLRWQLSRSGIGAEEVVRSFPGEIQAVLLYRSFERFKGRESSLLREKFIEMGWKNIQPNLWVLPPNKTPGGPANSGDLKIWLRRKLAKPFGKDFDYVFPVVAVLDMKRVTADKKGTRKMPVARTIYNVLEPSEIVPAGHLYSVMKARGFGLRDIILSGNIPFLASAFATTDELLAIQENEDALIAKLKSLTGSASMNLQDIANLGPDLIAQALGDAVLHGRDLAQRLIVEAQFWMRYLGGTVPSLGPTPGALPTAEEKVESVLQQEQWGAAAEEREREEEAEPAASREAWRGPGEDEGAEGGGDQESELQEEEPPKPRADNG